jgi:hypothetical protein
MNHWGDAVSGHLLGVRSQYAAHVLQRVWVKRFGHWIPDSEKWSQPPVANLICIGKWYKVQV